MHARRRRRRARRKILEGWQPPYTATVVERVVAAGCCPRRQDEPRRVRDGLVDRELGVRPDPQPARPDRVPGRVERRLGGRRRGGVRAARARFRHRRIDPAARRALRGRRRQAHLRACLALRPRSRSRVSLDQIGPFADDRRRRRAAARRRSAATTRSTPRRSPTLRRCSADVLGDGVARAARRHHRGAHRRRRRRARGARRGRATPPPRSRRRARRSTGSRCRARVYGLSAYYLIAPAEASSNLARYDGVRYGLRVDGDDVATMNARTRDAGFGAEVKRRIMLGTYALSAGYYDAYYGQAQRVRTLIIRDFDRVVRDVRRAALARRRRPSRSSSARRPTDPLAMYLSDVCTIPTNLAGHPAMSVPFGTRRRRPAGRRAGARARARRAGDVPGGAGARGRRAVTSGEQVGAEPAERAVETSGRPPTAGSARQCGSDERPDALGERDAAAGRGTTAARRGPRGRTARASGTGHGSNRRGTSSIARLPNAVSYAPQLARSLSASANGSVMKSMSAGGEVPGRGPEAVPVHRRDPRAAALRRVELGEQRVGVGALAHEVVGGGPRLARRRRAGCPPPRRARGCSGDDVLKKHSRVTKPG